MDKNEILKILDDEKLKKEDYFLKINYRNIDYMINLTNIELDFIKYNMLHLTVKPYVMLIPAINKVDICQAVILE